MGVSVGEFVGVDKFVSVCVGVVVIVLLGVGVVVIVLLGIGVIVFFGKDVKVNAWLDVGDNSTCADCVEVGIGKTCFFPKVKIPASITPLITKLPDIQTQTGNFPKHFLT